MPDVTKPPAAWTVLPPVNCPDPVRCSECETLHAPGGPCPWCGVRPERLNEPAPPPRAERFESPERWTDGQG